MGTGGADDVDVVSLDDAALMVSDEVVLDFVDEVVLVEQPAATAITITVAATAQMSRPIA